MSLLKLLRANGETNLMRVVSYGGQDLDGCTLETVERPWELGHFGGRRTLDKYLKEQMLFIHVWRQSSQGESLTNTALVQYSNASKV